MPGPLIADASTDAFAYSLRQLRVVFREAAADDIGTELERMGGVRTLVVCTPGRAQTAQRIAAGAAGDRIIAVFDGAREHVPADLVDSVTRLVARERPDSLIAVGGGSAIGLAKALALHAPMPILAVPTTYSGSEMTRVWGMTADGRKNTGRDERVAPRVIVYDPLLTYDLPAGTSVTSGMNAIAHAVEALYAPDANPVASLLAAGAIERLARALRALADLHRESAGAAVRGEATHARHEALLGAHLAGRALDMTSMGLHHKLCHALGGMFDAPHALTHAILLPCVASFLLPASPLATKAVSEALGEGDAGAGLFALRANLGIHATLRDLGLDGADLDAVAAAVAPAAPEHPRKPSTADVRAILEAAWRGRDPSDD